MISNKKKIFFLSGKRGGYDAMLPLSKKFLIKKNIDFKIIITGQHLNKRFGNTHKIVKQDIDNKNIIKIHINQKNSSSKQRIFSMNLLIEKLTNLFHKEKPNLLIVYGDRLESLAACFVAINMEIPICHFQGGDLSGNIDENIRHSITKLSNIHFASNYMSRKRLIQMGENPNMVFNIGDNHIDSLKKVKLNKTKILKKYNIKVGEEYCVLLFHPDGTSHKKNENYINIIINSLRKFKIKVISIFPCDDIAYSSIIKKLQNIKKHDNNFDVYPNIKYSDFINLVKFSKFLIGNSSSGIIESPYLQVPFLNLGNRQNNRLSSKNILHSKINKKEIEKKISKIMSAKFKKNLKNMKLYYGTGNSYQKAYKIILSYISKIQINKKFYEN